jgi:isopentenyl-diphosphate Delta-isomerase
MAEQGHSAGRTTAGSDDASTDDPDEVFDLVDAGDRVVGRVRRGDAHGDSALIHRSVQILVFASDGRLLLQRRSASKDLFPSYYCASASGHVASGEDYLTTARREIVEELGISPELTFASKMLVHSPLETEMTAIYLAQSDGPYHFHPTETAGGMLGSWDEIWRGRQVGSLLVTSALTAALEEVARLGVREALPAGFQRICGSPRDGTVV